MFTSICLICLCRNREYLDSFQNKPKRSCFKWKPKYSLFWAKLKWKGRLFWNEKIKSYPLNYLLPVGIMLAIIKASIILFLPCLWEYDTPWEIWKQINKISFQLSVQVYSPLGKTEGERKVFFGGCKKECHIVRNPKEHLIVIKNGKVSLFVKFDIIISLICCLLDPLTNKCCRAWSRVINFWKDFSTCQK